MSNFLAVATVTAAVQRLLQAAVGTDVAGAVVTTDRPETSTNGAAAPRVNVYLYQVVPNAALRNEDLPTRASGGEAVQRPRAALDLHYIITFYGSEEELEPQRLLGSVVRTLHAQPPLTAPLIQAVRADAGLVPPVHPSLVATDLDKQIDRVKLVPLALNLEELSKLWSVFFQTPYALSVAYQASVVLIEQDVALARRLPVLERGISVSPLRRPVIDAVETHPVAGAPIVAASTIAIVGRDLAGDVTLVRIAGSDLVPASATPSRIVLPLSSVPAGALRPGVHPVQIIQRSSLGIPPVPHVGTSSNVATFPLHPSVVSVNAVGTGASGTVTVVVDLPVGAVQDVVLALLAPGTGQRTHLFGGGPRTLSTTSLSVPVSGVPAGTHIAQVYVDGVETAVQRDGAGSVVGPTVTLL